MNGFRILLLTAATAKAKVGGCNLVTPARSDGRRYVRDDRGDRGLACVSLGKGERE